MPTIRVRVNVYAPTLVINGAGVASVWTEIFFDRVLGVANSVWGQADIEFYKQSFSSNDSVELMNPNSARRLIPPDQEFLAARFRASTGANVVLVNEASSRDPAAAGIGGAAMSLYRVCLLSHNADWRAVGVYLAHEFGHLLGLHDIYTGLGDNLMYGATGTGETRLDAEQRRTAARGARALNQPATNRAP